MTDRQSISVILCAYTLDRWDDLREAIASLRAQARALRRANAALRASEERFRAITESANDAIISADSAGNIKSRAEDR